MKQPREFVVDEKSNSVCKLKKSLYGLKQSSRQQYKKFDLFMLDVSFDKASRKLMLILNAWKMVVECAYSLFADDMFLASNDKDKVNK